MMEAKRVSARKGVCWLVIAAMFLTILGMNVTTVYAADENFTANAMAPLYVTDMNQFRNDLTSAKTMGVDAISVDVWWGDVEGQGDNQFNWNYYDTIFGAIKEKGLKIVPIMSFHQCGGNVGDNYTSLLPNWVWSKYTTRSIDGINLNANNLKYKSSQGNYCPEYLSLWADEVVANEYIDFMNAFEAHYGSLYASDILELNVSCGPSGELRYPSYNKHDQGTDYPTKGAFQCYSALSQADFRNAMIDKYGSLNAINNAWGSSMTSVNQITPPTDGENFFTDGSGSHPYYQCQYGRDFVGWYNGSLAEHGERMIGYAEDAFDGAFDDIPIGVKIPGVHWQMESQTMRAAEVTAGVINSDFSAGNGHGYNPILQRIATFGDDVVLHFTCLEMNDHSDNNNESAPKTLVGYVGDAANSMGIEIKGENALAGGDDYPYYWNNMKDAIDYHHYNGVTILRLGDVVNGASYDYYRDFIVRYHPPIPSESVTVNFTVNNAQTYWGQNIYVVGNIDALGNWNPQAAIKLDPTSYPTWTKAITLPANTTVEFKFIKKDGSGNVTWESCGNRTLTTGSTNTSYQGNWS